MKQICKQCGREFDLSDSEIQFYKDKGLSLPKRCKSCRAENKSSETAHGTSYGKSFWQKKPLWFCVLALVVIVCGALFFGGREDGGSLLPQEPLSTQGDDSSENSSIVDKPESSVSSEPEIPVPADNPAESPDDSEPAETEPTAPAATYTFRSEKYLDQHFEKHGGEFDYADKEEYLAGANRVINDPAALHKTEKEDGDYVFYLEATNEFVILSTDGYIRTYFRPSGGLDYYNRQ